MMEAEECLPNGIGEDFKEKFEDQQQSTEIKHTPKTKCSEVIIKNEKNIKDFASNNIKDENIVIKQEPQLITAEEIKVKVEFETQSNEYAPFMLINSGIHNDWDDEFKFNPDGDEFKFDIKQHQLGLIDPTINNLKTDIVEINISNNIEELRDGEKCKSEWNTTEMQILESTNKPSDQCTFPNRSKNNLEKHTQAHKFLCKFCHKSFSSKYSLDGHLLCKHKDEGNVSELITNKLYQCSKCSYQSVNFTNFNRHLGVHSDKKLFVCSVCHQSFQTKIIIDFHIVRYHSDNKQLMNTITNTIHECQQCLYKCLSSSHLKLHNISIHQEKISLQKFSCAHCEFSTYNKYNLQSHLVSHSNNKPYVCEMCSKSFRVKRYMDVHIVSRHADDEHLMALVTRKIHECHRCAYKCATKSTLQVHMLKHKEFTNMEKLNCAHCGFSTYNKCSLKRHLLIHRNNYTHVCTICSKQFRSKDKIDIHIVSRHSDNKHQMATVTRKIHECQQCSYKCIEKTRIKMHIMLKHK